MGATPSPLLECNWQKTWRQDRHLLTFGASWPRRARVLCQTVAKDLGPMDLGRETTIGTSVVRTFTAQPGPMTAFRLRVVPAFDGQFGDEIRIAMTDCRHPHDQGY